MAEWIYKATPTKATHDDTHDLAVFKNFLCRSAYEPGSGTDGLRIVPKVTEVAPGDLIHFYFRDTRGRVRSFGTFTVQAPTCRPGTFDPCDGHGCLALAIDSPANARLLARLRRGYEPDPKLLGFTGWIIVRVPNADAATPTFDQRRLLPGPMTTLWHYPDPTLPVAKKRTR